MISILTHVLNFSYNSYDVRKQRNICFCRATADSFKYLGMHFKVTRKVNQTDLSRQIILRTIILSSAETFAREALEAKWDIP